MISLISFHIISIYILNNSVKAMYTYYKGKVYSLIIFTYLNKSNNNYFIKTFLYFYYKGIYYLAAKALFNIKLNK